MTTWVTPFAIEIEPGADGTEVTLKPQGEIDIATGPVLEDRVEELVAGGVRRCALDLSGVQFIDSAGLHMVVHARAALRAAGGDLAIQGASASVSRLLEISGMTALLRGSHPTS